MTHRTLARVCMLAVMAAAAGQAQTRDTPRLPWGDPDLEGTWTNADRPARPGEVGAYNDAFFERGTGGVKSRRTSLVIDPPDGRIPPLTPEAQRKVEARQKHEAASPADAPEDRWLTERCILF